MPAGARYDVIVAGAGIVGASAAWHLAKAGLRVLVLDATGPAAGASGAADGSVSVASKKPGPAARLAVESLLHTAALAKNGGPLAGLFHTRPSYFFSTCAEEDEALDALALKLKSLDGPVRVASDGFGPSILPGTAPLARRMLALEGEGHMLGYQAVTAYLRHAGEGLETLWPARIMSASPENDEVTVTAELANGTLADFRESTLLVAGGLGSATLLPQLPLRPRAGQLIVTDSGTGSRLPGILTAASYLVQKTTSMSESPRQPSVIDPLATGQFLIGSSREDHGDPARTDFATLRRLLQSAADVWPSLRERRVLRVFAGVRAATEDGLPLFGTLSGLPGIVAATGFEGDGICLSALMGREVANLVTGKAPAASLGVDLDALSPDRFLARSKATARGVS